MIYVQIGNDKRNIADWKADSATLVFNSFGADEFQVDSRALNFNTANFECGTQVKVWQNEGLVFKGYVLDPSINKASDGGVVSITAQNAFALLEKNYFRTSWLDDHIPNLTWLPAIADQTKNQFFAKKYFFNWTAGDGIKVDERIVEAYTGLQFILDEFIPVARASNGNIYPSLNGLGNVMDFSVVEADFPTNYPILPYEEKDLCTLSEALEAITKWHPDWISFFDYSKEKPTMCIRPLSALEVASVPVQKTTSISINRNTITRPQSVILRVYKYEEKTHNTMWFRVKTFEDYAIGSSLYGTTIIPADFAEEGYSADQINPTALLSQINSILTTQVLSGSITLYNPDLTSRYLGKKLSITNSKDELQSINAPVQNESIDLLTGERTITIGNTNQPDIDGYVERLKYLLENSAVLKKFTPEVK